MLAIVVRKLLEKQKKQKTLTIRLTLTDDIMVSFGGNLAVPDRLTCSSTTRDFVIANAPPNVMFVV